MTLGEFQKKYPDSEDGKKAIAKMSREEIKEILDSVNSMGKYYIKRQWERLTGQKY